MALKVRPLAYALGAEICGIDVSRNLSEHEFGDIYRAFLEHGVLLLRSQNITREQHIEFSRRFGELDKHEVLPRDRRADEQERGLQHAHPLGRPGLPPGGGSVPIQHRGVRSLPVLPLDGGAA